MRKTRWVWFRGVVGVAMCHVQDGSKGKAKKKMTREKPKVSSEHWNDLFSLPKREGLMKGSDEDGAM
jgi:hypothetical protein